MKKYYVMYYDYTSRFGVAMNIKEYDTYKKAHTFITRCIHRNATATLYERINGNPADNRVIEDFETNSTVFMLN